MPILVKTRKSKSLEEWAIVELQGDLSARSTEDMHSQFIGDLYYNKEGHPILIIGHHILQGNEAKLEKPFALLEKSRTNEGEQLIETTQRPIDICGSQANTTASGNNNTLLDHTVAIEHKSEQCTEYVVRALCTKKLTFKSRPKPIIANVSKTV